MRTLRISRWIAAGCLAAGLSVAPPALACGGFFCSAQQPVNQSAERIIFAQNDDGTVTAVIQILYQGPSTDFSWLLPISTVPRGDDDIGIASDLAFQRLQTATNPNYVLTTRIEGTCDDGSNRRTNGNLGASPAAQDSDASGAPAIPPVSVAASGVVGSFEWAVILPEASLADPAAAATQWLEDNGYDVSPGAEALLGPYLEDGLYLLALKLVKDADVGSIRPIVLTYEASRPMIPIKLTAVAANDDMGVLSWLLGPSRSIPRNYRSLELNEARINWFNANTNYNAVVSEAADEAGGHGFVTEYADTTAALGKVVWSTSDEQQWGSLRNAVYGSLQELWSNAFSFYGTYGGFWDAARATVTVPNVAFEDFRACSGCYSAQVQFSPSAFFAALEKQVIEPNRVVQKLFDDHRYVTRLYSTLSAAEMTEDPLFGFNPDLPAVSNLHTAERVIECNSEVEQFEAPWRVALPQGDVVRGFGLNWPTATANEQPPTARILQLSESGPGSVLNDNTSLIDSRLAAHNATVRSRPESDSGCSFAVASRVTPSAAAWALVVGTALLGASRRRRRPTH